MIVCTIARGIPGGIEDTVPIKDIAIIHKKGNASKCTKKRVNGATTFFIIIVVKSFSHEATTRVLFPCCAIKHFRLHTQVVGFFYQRIQLCSTFQYGVYRFMLRRLDEKPIHTKAYQLTSIIFVSSKSFCMRTIESALAGS